MAYEIEYDAGLGCVVTVFTDTVDSAQFGDELMESHALADAMGTRLYLADLSEAAIEVDVFDIAATPDTFEALGGERPIAVALIPPASDEGRELAAFYKTVAVNRGWSVEIFEDRASAETWLGERNHPAV